MWTPDLSTPLEVSTAVHRRTPSLLLPEAPSRRKLAQFWTLSARDRAEVLRCQGEANQRRLLCSSAPYGCMAVFCRRPHRSSRHHELSRPTVGTSLGPLWDCSGAFGDRDRPSAAHSDLSGLAGL